MLHSTPISFNLKVTPSLNIPFVKVTPVNTNVVQFEFLSLSGSFTPSRHLIPSSGREHTVVFNLFSPVMMKPKC